MFLVVFRSNVHFSIEDTFLRARSGAKVKLRTPKIGQLEKNLTIPDF